MFKRNLRGEIFVLGPFGGVIENVLAAGDVVIVVTADVLVVSALPYRLTRFTGTEAFQRGQYFRQTHCRGRTLAGPFTRFINAQYQMNVIRHDGIGINENMGINLWYSPYVFIHDFADVGQFHIRAGRGSGPYNRAEDMPFAFAAHRNEIRAVCRIIIILQSRIFPLGDVHLIP